MQVLAQLLRKLKNTVDVDGDNLLDHSLIVCVSEFGSGRHWHTSLPLLLIGDPMYGGRWLNYMNGNIDDLEESFGRLSSGTNMNQFLLSILHHFGRSDDVFGYIGDEMESDPLGEIFLA